MGPVQRQILESQTLGGLARGPSFWEKAGGPGYFADVEVWEGSFGRHPSDPLGHHKNLSKLIGGFSITSHWSRKKKTPFSFLLTLSKHSLRVAGMLAQVGVLGFASLPGLFSHLHWKGGSWGQSFCSLMCLQLCDKAWHRAGAQSLFVK